jgi:FixJ family two-component response regulator
MLAARPIHVVDDDQGFLRGIERLLAVHGLTVRTFSSVDEFHAQADPDEAACLILDIHLGDVSGIDLMHELRQSGTTTPIVLITANDNEQVRRAALASGSSAFLQKPVSAKVLMEAVRNVVGPEFTFTAAGASTNDSTP